MKYEPISPSRGMLVKQSILTYPKLLICLCCPEGCSLFKDGGAPGPEEGGQPFPFCEFITRGLGLVCRRESLCVC